RLSLGAVRLRRHGQDDVPWTSRGLHSRPVRGWMAVSKLRNRRAVAQSVLEPVGMRSRAPRSSGRREPQRGIVLLIALIAMAAMAFSGMALVRVLDATTAIAGNMA